MEVVSVAAEVWRQKKKRVTGQAFECKFSDSEKGYITLSS